MTWASTTILAAGREFSKSFAGSQSTHLEVAHHFCSMILSGVCKGCPGIFGNNSADSNSLLFCSPRVHSPPPGQNSLTLAWGVSPNDPASQNSKLTCQAFWVQCCRLSLRSRCVSSSTEGKASTLCALNMDSRTKTGNYRVQSIWRDQEWEITVKAGPLSRRVEDHPCPCLHPNPWLDLDSAGGCRVVPSFKSPVIQAGFLQAVQFP